MRNNVTKLLLVFGLCFALAACNTETKETTKEEIPTFKVGIVNTQKIREESTVAQDAIKYMESYAAGLQEEMGKMEAELSQNAGNKEIQEKITQRYYELQREYSEMQQKVAKKMDKAFEGVIADLAKQESIQMVIPSEVTLFAEESMDITQKILDAMNARTVDFSAPDEQETPAVPIANATAPAANGTIPAATEAHSANATAPTANGTMPAATEAPSANATTPVVNGTAQ